MIRRPHWRTLLDPRDPDYMEPGEDESDGEDDPEPSEDDLARAASEAENNWRPSA